MEPKEIVVTSIGATSPLWGTTPDSWRALRAGESGISSLEHHWVAKHELPVTFAGQARVPAADVLERVEVKRLDPSSQFALIAAREAWADAGSPDRSEEHSSELQSRQYLVCRLLLETKRKKKVLSSRQNPHAIT